MKNKWIYISDALPPLGESVLTSRGEVATMEIIDKKVIFKSNGNERLLDVYCWMKIRVPQKLPF